MLDRLLQDVREHLTSAKSTRSLSWRLRKRVRASAKYKNQRNWELHRFCSTANLLYFDGEMECRKERAEKVEVLNESHLFASFSLNSCRCGHPSFPALLHLLNCHNHFSWLGMYFPLQLWYIQWPEVFYVFFQIIFSTFLPALVECLFGFMDMFANWC